MTTRNQSYILNNPDVYGGIGPAFLYLYLIDNSVQTALGVFANLHSATVSSRLCISTPTLNKYIWALQLRGLLSRIEDHRVEIINGRYK